MKTIVQIGGKRYNHFPQLAFRTHAFFSIPITPQALSSSEFMIDWRRPSHRPTPRVEGLRRPASERRFDRAIVRVGGEQIEEVGLPRLLWREQGGHRSRSFEPGADKSRRLGAVGLLVLHRG